MRELFEGISLLLVVLTVGMALCSMAADIERLQEENKRMESRITELMKEIETRTHPATVQRQMFE